MAFPNPVTYFEEGRRYQGTDEKTAWDEAMGKPRQPIREGREKSTRRTGRTFWAEKSSADTDTDAAGVSAEKKCGQGSRPRGPKAVEKTIEASQ